MSLSDKISALAERIREKYKPVPDSNIPSTKASSPYNFDSIPNEFDIPAIDIKYADFHHGADIYARTDSGSYQLICDIHTMKNVLKKYFTVQEFSLENYFDDATVSLAADYPHISFFANGYKFTFGLYELCGKFRMRNGSYSLILSRNLCETAIRNWWKKEFSHA